MGPSDLPDGSLVASQIRSQGLSPVLEKEVAFTIRKRDNWQTFLYTIFPYLYIKDLDGSIRTAGRQPEKRSRVRNKISYC
jgi:hypothetical protein